MQLPVNFLDLVPSDAQQAVREWVADREVPSYRAKQIHRYLWQHPPSNVVGRDGPTEETDRGSQRDRTHQAVASWRLNKSLAMALSRTFGGFTTGKPSNRCGYLPARDRRCVSRRKPGVPSHAHFAPPGEWDLSEI